MVEIQNWQNRGYRVSSGAARRQGLVIHGYGGNSGEMLGLAVGLALRLHLEMLVFDLPGHGAASSDPLTPGAAIASVRLAAEALEVPTFIVGHSLGARLGLTTDLPVAVLMSMPGPASFEGSRAELLRVLRARRVNENSAFSGLEDILANEVNPAPKTLMLKASRDLESVNSLASTWQKEGILCRKIRDSNHNDIVSSNETTEVIAGWLQENLC